MKSQKEIDEEEVRITNEFWDYLEFRNHPNVTSCKNDEFPGSHIMKTVLYYYEQKINVLEDFWEKKLLNSLIELYPNIKIEVGKLHITPLLYYVDMNTTEALYTKGNRGILMRYKVSKI